MTRRLRTIGFLALVLASACDREDCEERLIAAAAVGGPIGLLVAQAASCAANSRQNQLQFILIGGGLK